MYSYVTRMYSYVICIYSYVTRMYLYVTRMYSCGVLIMIRFACFNPAFIKWKRSFAFRIFLAHALQTQSDVNDDFSIKNPSLQHNFCNVLSVLDVLEQLNKFSEETYDVLSKLPNFTFKTQ